MRRRDFMSILPMSLALTGCGGDTYSWNQKLTVVVQTPGGLKSGSAICRVTVNVGDGGLNGHVMSQTIAGEATVVDLGGGKYLFALLSETGKWESMTANLAEFTFRDRVPVQVIGKSDRENLEAKYAVLENLREERSLPHGSLPFLVTFKDINDPRTVLEARPSDFTVILGAGFSLHTVKLEITDQTMMKDKIKTLLPWISTIEGRVKPTDKKYESELTAVEKLYSNAFIVGA